MDTWTQSYFSFFYYSVIEIFSTEFKPRLYMAGLPDCQPYHELKMIYSAQPLSPYSTGNWVCIGYQTQMKSTQNIWNVHAQREKFAFGTQCNLYSTDLRWGFTLGETQILGLASGKAKFCVFRYQHVGIPNAKLRRLGSKPMPGPNANGFASQWNKGFKGLFLKIITILMRHVTHTDYVIKYVTQCMILNDSIYA